MKKIISALLAMIMVFGISTFAFSENQTSVPEGYVGIYTAEDLNNIRNNLDGKYILMNDINLSIYESWVPIGTIDTPFTGELNGNGYYIKNLEIHETLSDSNYNIGLFGVAKDCLIDKIIIENGHISVFNSENTSPPDQNVTVGMIAAQINSDNNSSIKNCSAVGKIDISAGSSVAVGGLVGTAVNDNVIFSSSNYADINITTQNHKQEIYIGGILGRASADNNTFSESYLFIKKSAAFGNISINNDVASEETEIYVGGICANQISGNEFSECYNRGRISAATANGNIIIGGITAEAIWKIKNCYNTGILDIITDENDILNSICFIKMPDLYFPITPVSPEDFTAYSCYALNADIPLCSQNSDDSIVLYKNTYYLSDEEFRNQSSFANFDFETIWAMEENGYPVLKNQPTVHVEETVELLEGDVYNNKIIVNEWKSSNPDVATVNESGEIVAVSAGEAAITVNRAYGYTEEITVTVTKIPEDPKKNIFEKFVDFIEGLFECILTAIRYFFGFRPMF